MLAGNQTTNIVKDYFSNKHFIETNNNTSDIRKKLPEQQSIAEVEEVSTEDLSANPPI
ncbi:MAG: hypothetical protein LBD11_08370 [Candidatus Peribacteria bacterium]|jgi:ssDNA-binding replication factor A large subunit|nr:hypothetical protein [Candidatus Peribacteria bacterium]